MLLLSSRLSASLGSRSELSGWSRVKPVSRLLWPLEVLPGQSLTVSSSGSSTNVTIPLLITPSRRQTSVLCSILPDSRSLSTTDSNRSPSILSTRSSSSSSTTTCSLLSKRSTLRKVLIGSWWTSVWTWLLPSSCLRNLWVSGPSSRRSLFSLRQRLTRTLTLLSPTTLVSYPTM